MNILSRRVFLKSLGLSVAPIGTFAGDSIRDAGAVDLPPIRPITRGPRFHWFGYYDKHQFSVDDRLVLGNEVDFEHRSPRPDDEIRVGVVDLLDADRWIELGTSRAWNWQQGCMLQWLPGSHREVVWNDRQDDAFVARVLDVDSRRLRTLHHPVYSISPDGRVAVTTDFRRLNDCRPGYGYAGIPDPNQEVNAPINVGIWRLDMSSGEATLLLSLAEAAEIPFTGSTEAAFGVNAKHWFNHLLFNTDGTRFFFLHRWRNEPGGRFWTRAFTADREGKNLFCLDPYGETSHFIWRDPKHVMAWAWHPSHGERFYLYEDQTERVEVVGLEDMTENGHNTYVPATRHEWILNDTYPDRDGLQHPYLYQAASRRKVPLGHFSSPPEYQGEWRCDTHPRASRDGKQVCIDSPHQGGRQMYLIDIKGIVDEREGTGV